MSGKSCPRDNFSQDLVSDMDIEQIFHKHIIDEPCFFFRSVHSPRDDEYRMRKDFATTCGVSIHDVTIIGSARVGYSLKNSNFREFDSNFNTSRRDKDRSDIDLAIINTNLFNSISETIYDLSRHFEDAWIRSNWLTNQYYTDGTRNIFIDYLKYIAKGWIRPDYLPNTFLASAPWIEPCDQWKCRLNRKISVGIYCSWNHFKHYHLDNLSKIRAQLSSVL